MKLAASRGQMFMAGKPNTKPFAGAAFLAIRLENITQKRTEAKPLEMFGSFKSQRVARRDFLWAEKL